MATMTEIFQLPHRFGVLVVMIAIPLVNYLVNRVWVFRSGIDQRVR